MHVRYINFAIFNRGAELTLSNPWGLPPGFFSRGGGNSQEPTGESDRVRSTD